MAFASSLAPVIGIEHDVRMIIRKTSMVATGILESMRTVPPASGGIVVRILVDLVWKRQDKHRISELHLGFGGRQHLPGKPWGLGGTFCMARR
jgi:hypothetical protein